jgi:hypothetical protein
MSQELTMFDPKAGMPAHVASFFGSEEGSNIVERTTVPSLSPQGKQWTISLNGDKTTLMKKDPDGELVPVSVMKVIVLDYAKRRGRAYYEGAYDPANESAPVCWSEDGVAPPLTVEKRQSDKCETCPMAAKGSKISDNGKAVTACSQHRMLALIPANKLDFPPLRLKIPITSDFDKQSPDAEAAGWYAFSNYMDFLKSRGVQHTAAIVTKMKFDTNAAYPKIFFAADRWLTPEELAEVVPITKREDVLGLLAGTWTPAGVDGVKQEEAAAAVGKEQIEPAAGTEPTVAEKMQAVADKAKAEAAAKAPVETPAQKALREAQEAVALEQAGNAASGAAGGIEAGPKPASDDDGDGEIIGLDAPPATPKQEPAQAGVAVTQEKAGATAPTKPVDPALASLLAEWSD